jgi:uncharacterized protein (TIGR00251 family)
MAAAWRREDGARLVLVLHVQPGAKRTEVAGTHGDALKVRLAAPPLDGRANAALVRWLADAFGVPQRSVTLLRGAASRDKIVRVDAPARRPDRAWEAAPGA